MACRSDVPPNTSETKESGARKKRTVKPSPKALQNAIDSKRKELSKSRKELLRVMQSVEQSASHESEIGTAARDLATASENFGRMMKELLDLYDQDLYGDYTKEAQLVEENETLKRALLLVEKTKNRLSKSSKYLETRSVASRSSCPSSRLSSASKSSSTMARLQALADAKAAREEAQYARLIAQKELERRTRDAEAERTRQQEIAQFESEMAILSADKRAAIANAKLEVFEDARRLEENLERESQLRDFEVPEIKMEHRTSRWVYSSPTLSPPRAENATRYEREHDPRDTTERTKPLSPVAPKFESLKKMSQQPKPPDPNPDPPGQNSTNEDRRTHQDTAFNRRPLMTSTPFRDVTGSQLIDSLTAVNQQIVAGLARQNLPKCQPDVFSGDPSLFHPWKSAFKAMLIDTDVSPIQEINYLRSFTSGPPQRLVDNYRKRQMRDPVALLRDLWAELEKRFGSAAVIANALLERLRSTATFSEHEHVKLQQFADLCADIESQVTFLPGLECLDYPSAIQPIAEKLPKSIRAKWEKEISNYSDSHRGMYPPFSRFSKTVQEQAKIKNNPNVLAGKETIPSQVPPQRQRGGRDNRSLKTEVRPPAGNKVAPGKSKMKSKHCPYHESGAHDLSECVAFAAKSLEERTQWIMSARLCLRCLSNAHIASECDTPIQCAICGDKRHSALLHKDRRPTPRPDNGAVNPKCTTLCEPTGGLSCSKTLLVDIFNKRTPHITKRIYAIVDEQSNSSLITSELADDLGASGPLEKYFLSTCSGDREEKYGRRLTGVAVRSTNGVEFTLPTLTECDNIPQDKREIPTSAMARRFPHLSLIANEIPPLDDTADVHLLIGRDAPELLKVRESRNGPSGAPWAQRLALGWTISGQLCLDFPSGPAHVLTRLTSLSTDTRRRQEGEGKCYELVPCPNQFKVTDPPLERAADGVFKTTRHDNEPSLSLEDRTFLEIMDKGIHKNASGNWEMPLPFRDEHQSMPNNRAQAMRRLQGLLKMFVRKPEMKTDYLEFMGKIIEKGHASPVPRDEVPPSAGRFWYLPHFATYHNTKRTIRVVFDSSCEFQGVSLNKALLPGPDLMNNLIGVLIRFRKENVAVMCDVEQMFHSFHVDPKHRDFLRFLWFEGNDPTKPVTEYRMNVHLFGNGPSPAVATYGLRRTAVDGEEENGEETKNFICRNFYVDDGLASLPTAGRAIKLVKGAQATLATAKLRLHKVVSNSVEVMEAFPTEDRGKDVRDLDLRCDSLPALRSLGVFWDLETDTFTFEVSLPEKPFTRRGVLSIVNSVYDPLGFAAPVMLEGRKILQQLVLMGERRAENKTPLAWDDPLPTVMMNRWTRWRDSLVELQHLSVPRCYHPREFGTVTRAELHAFSDASQDAIGVAVYLRQLNEANEISTSLVYGQAKVAPVTPTSIPRLELCGAVLAVQAAQRVLKEIDMKITEVIYYTDSKVVLGYIANESRRFYVYVANRVQLIRSLSTPEQWRYVESEQNPADLATRGVPPDKLMESSWLKSPEFLKKPESTPQTDEMFTLSTNDPEVRKGVLSTKVTTDKAKGKGLGAPRFKRFSSLKSLQQAVARLIVVVGEFKRRREPKTGSVHPRNEPLKVSDKLRPSTVIRILRTGSRPPTVEERDQALRVIISTTQREAFGELLQDARTEPELPRETQRSVKKSLKGSRLYHLDPFLDAYGILRVGGRLRRAEMEYGEKHPVVLPKNHHASQLVAKHYHAQVHHQGRLITGGAIRQAGFWLIGGHDTVTKVISACVPCKKLRGPPLEQRMADLPRDRTEVCPPFTNVGFDVFGPWMVQTRKTRGGAANAKRWGLVFTCLSSRAIHIEVLEAMDTSAFICALRRFFALRGHAKLLRCDRGTNFVGAKTELKDASSELNEEKVKKFVTESGCEWELNPPHASHFGGVWERQINTIRRVLDAMFAELGRTQLTHELLITLMAEVVAIVNARPITALPSDPDDPRPLSPAMLLTMKTRPAGPSPGQFTQPDLYVRRRWRRVQCLADQFWTRWRREYLQSLQRRPKWTTTRRNLRVGDIVLLRDDAQRRNNWPLGRVTEAIESEDGRVRKANVEIARDGEKKVYLRPIKELTLLLPNNGTDDADPSPA